MEISGFMPFLLFKVSECLFYPCSLGAMLAIEGFGGHRLWNQEGLSLTLNYVFKRHAGYKAAEVDEAYVTLTQL